MRNVGRSLSYVALAAVLLASPAMSQSEDCMIIEGWYKQSALTPSWPTGNCCSANLTNNGFIVCDKQTASRVMELVLPGQGLAGPIPTNLNALSQLRVLSLANNHLVGAVPDLTGLVNLIIIDVSNNMLSSFSGDSVAGLNKLEILDVNTNNLTGNFPDLHGLTSLVSLWMYQNNLAGSVDGKIPASASDCAILDGPNNTNMTVANPGNKGIFTCGGSLGNTNCFDDGVMLTKGTDTQCAAVVAGANSQSGSPMVQTPDGKPNAAAIGGGVVGAVLFLALIGGGAIVYRRRRAAKASEIDAEPAIPDIWMRLPDVKTEKSTRRGRKGYGATTPGDSNFPGDIEQDRQVR
ncbi:L domain-like protein [Gonapodya prolifera JEL478]|uniref:L domain-like protein n=1 Tax=Gonapodya prolifera (strain JEL478) TaxID=1344416 RepID=A0A139AW46_GONPJ|nr:L domain-like protein [Gonapodya prolifera JEL478]|eukprot:KXS20962.1 L domain-like protein [Gonapodya prolifera JEL478]